MRRFGWQRLQGSRGARLRGPCAAAGGGREAQMARLSGGAARLGGAELAKDLERTALWSSVAASEASLEWFLEWF